MSRFRAVNIDGYEGFEVVPCEEHEGDENCTSLHANAVHNKKIQAKRAQLRAKRKGKKR